MSGRLPYNHKKQWRYAHAEFDDYAAAIDETTFDTSVALERAQATIADHERTVITAEDREVVLAALENPAPPTDALREAMAMYAARVVQGD